MEYQCCDCGKIFKSDVKELGVPFGIKGKYHIETIYISPCPQCTVAVRTGTKYICLDCGTVKDETKIEYVAKSQKDYYKVDKTETPCSSCETEREKLERQTANLTAKFGFGSLFTGNPSDLSSEISVMPGGEIRICLYVRNKNLEPINSEIKLIVRNAETLDTTDSATPGIKENFKKLTCDGLKVADEILPFDSPYYPKCYGLMWDSHWNGFLDDLILQRLAQPGQDIILEPYLKIRHKELRLDSTATIHVMYPSKEQQTSFGEGMPKIEFPKIRIPPPR